MGVVKIYIMFRIARLSIWHSWSDIFWYNAVEFTNNNSMADTKGAEAVDKAIARGLDLDGSPIPANKLNL